MMAGMEGSYLISFPPQLLLILSAVLVVLSNNQGGNRVVAHVPAGERLAEMPGKGSTRGRSLDPGRPDRELGRAVVLSSGHDVELAQWIGWVVI